MHIGFEASAPVEGSRFRRTRACLDAPDYEIQLVRHLTRYNGMSVIAVEVDWLAIVMI